MFVWGDEDLSLLGAHSEEGHIIHGVQISDDVSCLLGQISYSSGELLWVEVWVLLALLESKYSLVLVYNEKQFHTLVVTNSGYSLLNFCHISIQ